VSTRRPVAAVALGAALLAGCGQPVKLGSGELACRVGDAGEPANGVVLMAQAVPTASWVPCLDTVPLGWRLADVQIRDGSGRFFLDGDRDGTGAIEMRLTASCDTRDATPVPSDRAGVGRYELVRQMSPDYVGTRFYLFSGGCLSVHFKLTGDYRAEPLAVATEGIELIPRNDVEAHVLDASDGRLQLDVSDGAP
jgi:hypothetical protein